MLFLVLFRFRVTSLFSPVYFAFIQAVKQHASSLNVTWHCPYPHNCQYAPLCFLMYCRLYCNWPVYAVKWSGANPWALFSDIFAPLWIKILSKIHFLEYHLIARWHHMYVKKHFFWRSEKRTWGDEFLGQELDSKGGLDWDLPRTAVTRFSCILFNPNQPDPVTLGWQTQPPCPQLQDNKPLETAIKRWIEHICAHLTTSLRCEGWGCLRSASNFICMLEWNSVT